jgi:GABA permease
MTMTQSANADSLAQNLKPRHVRMLSIAGVIGAGLFVGSGHAISEAGPAVLISYAAAGALVVLIMRMLAEMAVASPDSGSFSTYADKDPAGSQCGGNHSSCLVPRCRHLAVHVCYHPVADHY